MPRTPFHLTSPRSSGRPQLKLAALFRPAMGYSMLVMGCAIFLKLTKSFFFLLNCFSRLNITSVNILYQGMSSAPSGLCLLLLEIMLGILNSSQKEERPGLVLSRSSFFLLNLLKPICFLLSLLKIGFITVYGYLVVCL